MLLSLAGFGVAFGDQVVLVDVSLHLPRCGTFVIVGPAGAGKSTLLRTVAGLNAAQPSLRTWGYATFDGLPLSSSNHPQLVHQNARLLGVSLRENLVSGLENRGAYTKAEQDVLIGDLLASRHLSHLNEHLGKSVALLSRLDKRRVAIVRQLLRNPKALLVDEPTTALDDEDVGPLLALLRHEAEHRAVLVVTHNQAHARSLGGTTALLAGGVIHDVQPTEEFFSTRGSPPKDEFLRTGRCSIPSPNARPEDLAEDAPRPYAAPQPTTPPEVYGPRGFFWLLPGQLGGCPRPGVVGELEHDLDALQRLDASVVVNLEETIVYPVEPLVARGFELWHQPIDDMDVPSLADAAELCAAIEGALAAGKAVVVHCRAGLGRTGLFMALYLIWQGTGAAEAFDRVRDINPKWIQSDSQIDFLPTFQQFLGRADGGPPARV